MPTDTELILDYYKSNPLPILKRDRDNSLTSRPRPWRGCFPKKFFKYLKPEGDCWLWTGLKTQKGTPLWEPYLRGQKPRASGRQLMWRWAGNEAVPFVTSNCGNPLCLRPSHLQAGRKEHKRTPYSQAQSDAPPPTNDVQWGTAGLLKEFLKTEGPGLLQPGNALPCTPQAFWRKVRVGKDGCWDWYGAFSQKKGPYYTSYIRDAGRWFTRRAYHLTLKWSGKNEFVGEWKKVYRVCGNYRCVNPDHVERGVGHKYKPRAARPKPKLKSLLQLQLDESGYV